MCNTCEGQIILRTGDGFEKIIKVADCDIKYYETLVMDRHKSMAVSFTYGGEIDTLPTETHYHRRTYKWNYEMRDGIRVLDEVIPEPTNRKSMRHISALEELQFEEVLNDKP